jgi:nitrate reductase molybdenum cofactor assembly chaperone NarJ/NarW
MAVCDTRTQVLSLLGDLLEYPLPTLPATVVECRELVAGDSPRAAGLLGAFLEELERTPSGRVEELYAGAFDFDRPTDVGVSCYPYIGHHLLGESYRRSRFMVGLQGRYREHGFEVPPAELPDHVLVVLRFLAHAPDTELAEEVVGEALLPALSRMTHEGAAGETDGESGRGLYIGVLEAIRLVLHEQLWPNTTVCSYPLALEHGPVPEDVGPGKGCAA